MADLKVRWRGELYEIPTCLGEGEAAKAMAQWPDGVIDIATMFEPGRSEAFSEHQRRQLAHMVLEALGEPTLGLHVSSATLGKTDTKAVPAGFGTIGKAVTSRPVELRRIDHAYLQELAAAPRKGRLQPATAMRKLETSSSDVSIGGGEGAGGEGAGGEGSCSSSSGGEGSSGGDGGTL
jgi:uncharacterized membrane protein YgcG